jgi:anti-anti-sigma factor
LLIAGGASRKSRYRILHVDDGAGNVAARYRENRMPILIQHLEGDVTKVILSGRIDIAGAREIDMPLAVVAGSRRAVVIDLTEVEFMASLGLRGIVVSAKSILSKRGKIVLLSPKPNVEEVITITGVDELIPIYRDEASAIAAVLPTAG